MFRFGKTAKDPLSDSKSAQRWLASFPDGDPLAPQSRWLATWWPGAQLVEIPDADHGTVLSHPRTLQAMRSIERTQSLSGSDR